MRIGITLGDPAGIGPEIVRAALDFRAVPETPTISSSGKTPIVLVRQTDSRNGSRRAPMRWKRRPWPAREAEQSMPLSPGRSIKRGCTRSVSSFPDKPSFLPRAAAWRNFAMLLTGGKLTVALVTTHIPFARSFRALQASRNRPGRFAPRRFSAATPDRESPRIAVAGLNPHAGESGALGREEIEIIEPGNRRTERALQGHSPPSQRTVFSRHAFSIMPRRANWDAVLCMYHDQGLIPLKLHAFFEGVNVTLGFPFRARVPITERRSTSRAKESRGRTA